ncbi:hypothetical protein HUG20_09250 [Salicibibacter cibi]|uniref:Uncharacterized protein n=1 Tax=Salicibibacter cibi TaxID=2743001 RepID=A0A7T6ZAT7_9BACI|nr:hypothetical protein [Salicibibacter cibi]QQK80055.1 hypothetical protein HUG20_09250 [Salicibibacter cibi]
MKKINLRDLYPYYRRGVWVEIEEEVLEELCELERKKHAYHRRMYRYQAHYSLNREDGIEHQVLFPSPSKEEQIVCRI